MTKDITRREPRAPARIDEPGVEELIEQFLSHLSKNTRRAYDADLRDFAAFLGKAGPVEAMDHLIKGGFGRANWIVRDYLTDMAQRELSPATCNRRLSAIRSALKLGRRLELLTWTLDVDSLKVRPYRDTTGPQEEAYRAMLEVADARDTAMLRLLHDLALRRGELVELDLADVDLRKRKLSILGKGRLERETLTIPEATADALKAWIRERGKEPGPLFTSRARPAKGKRLTGDGLGGIVGRLGREAGVGKVRPHGLRHTGITTALERTNGNISKVARYSRHASIETVRRYDDNRRDVAGEVAELVSRDEPPDKD